MILSKGLCSSSLVNCVGFRWSAALYVSNLFNQELRLLGIKLLLIEIVEA